MSNYNTFTSTEKLEITMRHIIKQESSILQLNCVNFHRINNTVHGLQHL